MCTGIFYHSMSGGILLVYTENDSIVHARINEWKSMELFKLNDLL